MKTNTKKAPRLGEWILKQYCSKEDSIEKLGDYTELFNCKLKESGRAKAFIWYYMQILRLIVGDAKISLYWGFEMFRNYSLTAYREIKKNKIFSFINISGLALGLTAFILIANWMMYEFSFDRFHRNASSIYRVVEKLDFHDKIQYSRLTPGPLGPALEQKFPELKKTVRVAWTGERIITQGTLNFYENSILTVDPAFFTMFSFPFLQGEAERALDHPFSIVITEDIADKYFGKENPVGKILNMDNRYDFLVTGVIKNVPYNSYLQFDMAVPFEIVEKLGWNITSWTFSMAATYIQVQKTADVSFLENKIAHIVESYDPSTNRELFLQPLTSIHLFSGLFSPTGQGRIQYIVVVSLIALLILIMACVNFMNLSTARAEHRAVEIGLRKVIGAHRHQLIRQFLAEAVFMAFIALICVPVLLQLVLPVFNKLTGSSFNLLSFANLSLLFMMIGVTVITGLFAGSYPAFFLSVYQPVKGLGKGGTGGLKGAFLRKSLVFIQISISLALIIIASVIYKQIDFIRNKDLGYDKDHIITVPLGIGNKENRELYERFRHEIEEISGILNVSASFHHPTNFGSRNEEVFFRGKNIEEITPVHITSVDFNYLETLKIQILRGRSFSRNYGEERGHLIVNQMFENLLGVESSLGEVIRIGDNYEGTIIGVIKDFHQVSVSEAVIRPLVLFLNPSVNYIILRIDPVNISADLEKLQSAWKNIAPHIPFKFSFLDEDFDSLFQDTQNFGTAVKYLTIIAVFIACLGLFGLISFSAEKRTKEIGIRKVLGAKMSEIIYLLSQDFIKIVILAHLLSVPLSWYLMKKWLDGYPYHVNLGWGIFVQSGLMILGVTVITVFYQMIKASLANPVDSLKNE